MSNQPNSFKKQVKKQNEFLITQKEKTEEINFQNILDQTKEDKSQQSNSSPTQQKKSKIIQAIRNSQLARVIYHNEQEPDKKIQNIILKQQIQKGILTFNKEQVQNELLSTKNVSKFLDLAPIVENSQMQNQEEDLRSVLLKQSPSFFGSWSQRYCILSKHRFIYKQTQSKQSSTSGIINFDLLSLTLKLITDHQNKIAMFKIIVDQGNKQFVFKGKDIQTTNLWAEKLKVSISNSFGKKQKLTYLGHYNRFWRKDYISEYEFRKTAQTGDILLFRGKKTSAVLQRKLTFQEYDHIGVLLLNKRGQIIVFQANGGLGVGLCPWKKFIKNKWYKDQDIVAYRKLIINRPPQFLIDVEKFVEGNIGKSYKFSLTQYFFTNRHSSAIQQKQTFFCSSLVAKLYKTLGLLDQKISSSQYMPYSFAQKSNIILQKGRYGEAKLQHEQILVFEEKLLEKNKHQIEDNN